MSAGAEFDRTGVSDGWAWERTVPKAEGTVLLLHSIGLDRTFWADQVAALAERFNVITVDLPGHGRSGPMPADTSFETMADDLSGLLERFACAPVHLVGCSVGGMLAQVLALQHPQVVCSLALLSTAASFSETQREAMRGTARQLRQDGAKAGLARIENWVSAEALQRSPELRGRLEQRLLADDPEAVAGLYDLVAAHDLAARLAEIECPTLVLVAEGDRNTPVAQSEHLASGIPGARLVVLQGDSHLCFIDQPKEVNRELLSFLASAGGPDVDRDQPV